MNTYTNTIQKLEYSLSNADYNLKATNEILRIYNKKLRNWEDMKLLYKYEILSKEKIKEVFTIIHRKNRTDDWANHFHATVVLGITRNRKKVYYEFNHRRQFIEIYKTKRPPSITRDKLSMVLCHIKTRHSERSLGDVIAMAINHWYNVNYIKSLTMWPTSCTGFTDLITYYIFGRQILKKCPLTKQRGKGHPLYNKEIPTIIPANIKTIYRYIN